MLFLFLVGVLRRSKQGTDNIAGNFFVLVALIGQGSNYIQRDTKANSTPEKTSLLPEPLTSSHKPIRWPLSACVLGRSICHARQPPQREIEKVLFSNSTAVV